MMRGTVCGFTAPVRSRLSERGEPNLNHGLRRGRLSLGQDRGDALARVGDDRADLLHLAGAGHPATPGIAQERHERADLGEQDARGRGRTAMPMASVMTASPWAAVFATSPWPAVLPPLLRCLGRWPLALAPRPTTMTAEAARATAVTAGIIGAVLE